MNSSFVCKRILVKSKIPNNCLINYLNEVSSQSLRSYLRLSNIYDGCSNKRKSYLIEITIYRCMNGNLRNRSFDDISNSKVSLILKEKNISIKSLPGYGNLELKKKELKPYTENK